MKLIPRILLTAGLMMALLFSAGTCPAEEAFAVEDTGLDLAETLSVHYPALTGGENEELTQQINDLIREECGIKAYLSRAAQLMSGGSLTVEWKGGLLNDVFSCAVSAAGAVENNRPTHVWTACTAALRDGRKIILSELFTDEEAARAAGIPFIHAAYGFGSAEAPDGVIRDITELPEIIRRFVLNGEM